MNIKKCRRVEVNLEKIVDQKNNLPLREFKPNTGYNVELVVGTYEFHNIKCETPYATASFDDFIRKVILRFNYEFFWQIVAKFEASKIFGNGERIVDGEKIKDISLMFKCISVSILLQ